MTEKRFRLSNEKYNETIFDNGVAMGIIDVVEKLNELAEENKDNKAMIEFLSIENTQIMDEVKTRTQIQHQLEEENEQLKQQLTSISQLIDNKIDEFKNGDYGDLPCNTIHMFLDLKQEMEDLE